jgi:VanZ family protein
LKYYIPAIIWAAVIFILSASPGQNLPQIDLGDLLAADKIAHFGVYLILTLCLFWAFFRRKRLNTRNIIYAILITSGYGILLEIGQYYIFPGRYFELFDIVANISGSIGSLLFLKFFYFK